MQHPLPSELTDRTLANEAAIVRELITAQRHPSLAMFSDASMQVMSELSRRNISLPDIVTDQTLAIAMDYVMTGENRNVSAVPTQGS